MNFLEAQLNLNVQSSEENIIRKFLPITKQINEIEIFEYANKQEINGKLLILFKFNKKKFNYRAFKQHKSD